MAKQLKKEWKKNVKISLISILLFFLCQSHSIQTHTDLFPLIIHSEVFPPFYSYSRSCYLTDLHIAQVAIFIHMSLGLASSASLHGSPSMSYRGRIVFPQTPSGGCGYATGVVSSQARARTWALFG